MKAIGKERNESSSKNKSEEDGKEVEGESGDDIDTIEFAINNRNDATSVEKGTAINVFPLNKSDYLQTDFFVKVEQMDDPDVPLRNDSSSHVTSLRASFYMYGFH